MSLELPKIIGHRGACAYAPENTLVSIQTAYDIGAEWVELDVKLTSEGVAIIFHDDELDRTTNGNGLVKDTPYSVIKDLDAGSWFADSFYDTPVPTLEQALELIIELGLGLNLEIKPCEGREVETAQVALDILSRYWDDHDKIIISSFSEESLMTAADMLGGDWAIGYLIDEVPENWAEIAEQVGAKTVNINGNRTDLTQDFINDIIESGYDILAYTINNPDMANRLISWGVDGIFTDEPDTIKEELISLN
jgi:glycerophosphoryl diester phosphodiesterase